MDQHAASGAGDDHERGWVQGRDPPVHRATATPAVRTGSIAVPGPTIASANTGSGTCASGTARPGTGASTANAVSTLEVGPAVTPAVLDVAGQRVRLRTDHDLDDPAGGQHPIRPSLLQRSSVH